MTPHLLLTCDQPVLGGVRRRAGLEVRVLEMGRALERAGCRVTVLAPSAPGANVAFPHVATAAEALAASPTAWVATPLLAAGHGLVGRLPLVLDCYEPLVGSFLHFSARPLDGGARRVAAAEYACTVAQAAVAMAQANLILVANERQRASVLTMLALLGALDHERPPESRVLIVPSGVPPLPDVPTPPSRDRRPTVLWAGGAYVWFDLETPLHATRLLCAARPDLTVVFAGLDGVTAGAVDPAATRLRGQVDADPVLAPRCRFDPWQPYEERRKVYADADVAWCTFGDHLETYLSMRTRLLDLVWAGVPSVCSSGDALSAEMAAADAAVLVRPADPRALADGTTALIDAPSRRAAMRDALRALAVGPLAWNRCVAPLVTWARAGTSTRRRTSSRALPVWRPPGKFSAARLGLTRLWYGLGRRFAGSTH